MVGSQTVWPGVVIGCDGPYKKLPSPSLVTVIPYVGVCKSPQNGKMGWSVADPYKHTHLHAHGLTAKI